MDFFLWQEKYSVGVASIDKQHQRLVGHLNDLYSALNAGKGKEALGDLFSGLIGYTRTHFASEEELMKMYGFPGYQEHREIHDRMAAHVVSLDKKFKGGEISSPHPDCSLSEGVAFQAHPGDRQRVRPLSQQQGQYNVFKMLLSRKKITEDLIETSTIPCPGSQRLPAVFLAGPIRGFMPKITSSA